MQITSQRHHYQTQASFQGLRNKDARALFAFDLDGTLAHGSNEDIKKVLELARKANATLSYATGRTAEKLVKLQQELLQKQIFLPNPQFLIGRNSLVIHENICGKLTEDAIWSKKCTDSFEEAKIVTSANRFSLKKENIMPYAKHKAQPTLKDSKLCPFSFWPVPNMVSFICDSSISGTVEKELSQQLLKDGIPNFRITRQIFTKETCDKLCNAEQLEVINPRYSHDNKSTQIDITAANKADGVKYLAQKLSIPNEEILMAGDDLNDVSMANMSAEGSFFVRVANCVEEFKEITDKIKDKHPFNLISASKEGTAGIAEGIEQVLAKFGQK